MIRKFIYFDFSLLKLIVSNYKESKKLDPGNLDKFLFSRGNLRQILLVIDKNRISTPRDQKRMGRKKTKEIIKKLLTTTN